MPQVQELSKKGLKREFQIKVAQKDVEQKWLGRLEEIGKEARLPGFRPGKVPLPVLKQKFGPGARSEILDQAVAEAAQKALSERNLRPAAEPQIELLTFSEGQDLEFKLAIEILPDIAAPDFSKIALERLAADVEDKAVDDAINRIVKSIRQPEAVAGAAQKGDVAVIDFEGQVDGKTEPGMQGQNHNLELGSNSFIGNFEEQMEGLKAGDKKTVKVTFPKEYHAAHLAGKKAEFAVTVTEVRRPKPVEMNDALAMELGLANIAELRQRVKDDIAAQYAGVARAIVKRKLLDKLAESQDFEVPAGMVEAEFNGIWAQVEEAKKNSRLAEDEAKKSDEQLKKDYRAIAERRIRLGLLLADVARREKLEVSPPELRNAMIAEARRFPGQEKAVVDYYTQTEGAIERLRAPLLEEKVIDHILGKAKVTEKKIPADELLKMPGEME